MLIKAALSALMVVVCLTVSPAQSTQSSDEYNKNEFYIGYTHNRVDGGGGTGLNGIQGSYTRNVSRFFGIRVDVSHAWKSREFGAQLTDPTTGTYTFRQDNNRSVTNFLAGVQFKDNRNDKRFKPFAYALAGVAHNRTSFKNLRCASGNCPTTIPIVNNFTFRDTGFGAALGGGLDIKLSRRFDLRVIQVDYNPIYSDSRVDNNVRIGAGIVIK